MNDINGRYLNAQIRYLIRNEFFIRICDQKNTKYENVEFEMREKILNSASEFQVSSFVKLAQQMRVYEFPEVHSNPALDLHYLNKKIIIDIAEQIVDDPGLLDSDYSRTFQGNLQKDEYGFTMNSYRGGEWHPEDLFLNSDHNRKNHYFERDEIWINPQDKYQPGNRYKLSQNGAQIPFFQNPNKRRNYADVTEGLRSDSDSRSTFSAMTFDMPANLTASKNRDDFYLSFPDKAKWDCGKVKQSQIYNY